MPIVDPVPIPAAPTPPQRNDHATFEERNDAAVEYQFVTLPPAINQQAEAAYQNALESKLQAEGATTKAGAAAGSAAAAASSAQAAAAAATQTGGDRIATGADRVQTGLDRTATGQDRVATAEDRQAVEEALAGVAGGPVVTFNGRGGVVVLEQEDVLPLLPPLGEPVGSIHVGIDAPSDGAWIETGNLYLKASYPDLFAEIGVVPNAEFNFVQEVLPFAATATNIHVAGDKVFATGNVSSASGNTAMRSASGSWEVSALPTITTNNGGYWKFAYGEGVYVGVAQGSSHPGTIASSPDAVSWSIGYSTPEVYSFRGVAYGNGRFVAVTQSTVVQYSDNGVDGWTLKSAPTMPANPQGIVFGNGVFVAYASNGSFAVSTDGETWTNGAVGVNITSLVFTGEQFIASSPATGTFATSADGVSWILIVAPFFMPSVQIAAGGGYFYTSIHPGKRIAISKLPLIGTWTVGSPNDQISISSMAVFSGKLISSTATSGVVMVSDVISYDTGTQFHVPKYSSAPYGELSGYKERIKAA